MKIIDLMKRKQSIFSLLKLLIIREVKKNFVLFPIKLVKLLEKIELTGKTCFIVVLRIRC